MKIFKYSRVNFIKILKKLFFGIRFINPECTFQFFYFINNMKSNINARTSKEVKLLFLGTFFVNLQKFALFLNME